MIHFGILLKRIALSRRRWGQNLRLSRSAESWIGVSGFLISWATRRAHRPRPPCAAPKPDRSHRPARPHILPAAIALRRRIAMRTKGFRPGLAVQGGSRPAPVVDRLVQTVEQRREFQPPSESNRSWVPRRVQPSSRVAERFQKVNLARRIQPGSPPRDRTARDRTTAADRRRRCFRPARSAASSAGASCG